MRIKGVYDSPCRRPGCLWAAPVSGCVSTSWVWEFARLDHSGLPVSPRCCPCPPSHCPNCCQRSTGCSPCWCLLGRTQLCFQTEEKTVRNWDICLPSHSLCYTLWSVFISSTLVEIRKVNAKVILITHLHVLFSFSAKSIYCLFTVYALIDIFCRLWTNALL